MRELSGRTLAVLEFNQPGNVAYGGHGQHGELQEARAIETLQCRTVESAELFLADGQQAGQPECRPASEFYVHIDRLDEARFLELGNHRTDDPGAFVDKLKDAAHVLEVR